jgi:branched-chain amino acid transport system substrate-binding protein
LAESTARRLVAALLVPVLAAVGCEGNSGTGDEVRGTTLSVYVSVPLHGPRAPEGRAIVDGAKLALRESGGEIGDLEVEAVYLDDSGGQASGWNPVASADNARQAAEDVTAIGYIGELDSGATRTSLPITNQAGMAHVSPGSTAVDLTRTPTVGPGPERLQPSDEQTFIRLPPADDLQAGAAALLAKRTGARVVGTISDGSAYGRIVTRAFVERSQRLGLSAGPAAVARGGRLPRNSLGGASVRPDAFYLGGTPETMLAVLQRAAAERPDAQLLGPDALLEGPFLRAAGPAAEGLELTSSFLDPSRLPPPGQRFIREYRAQFGYGPAPAAAYGYEAMALLLDAISRAGDDGDDRATVIDELFATRDRRSAIGTYSVQGSGDTTLNDVSVYRVSDGLPVFETAVRAPP